MVMQNKKEIPVLFRKEEEYVQMLRPAIYA